jgi:flagellar hook-associated protein 3 FlgL
VARPSQDPAQWSQISAAGTELGNISVWRSNIDSVRATAAQVEDSLSHIADGLIRVRELAIQAASASTGAPARNIIAAEIETVRDQIGAILHSRDAHGQPFFPDGPALAIPVGQQDQAAGQIDRRTIVPLLSGIDSILTAVEHGTDVERSQAASMAATLIDTLASMQTANGLVQQQLERLSLQHQQTGLVQSERRSAARDTDISATISLMQKLMVNLQAAQASYTRIAQSNLFDFLQ